ncbi:hypothetical protein HRG_005170 [Hirsutella rhossiliensis]|uniref:Uncharacterized protein n=1 Tax=Hirsutella rhossiliensis TaxID=111463 RepID=A0A9P8N0N5_9HYPO|nr:uncharacterized protein HRG_05170 [Hirsutella rhossiliensis]KAH0964742.1 hypothetical protein HRG_05170 [Hirsutella rhossiliensis]
MAPKRFAAEKADPSPLAQPLKFDISGKTAKNRFMKAAMTERLSSWDPKVLEKRGVPSKELVNVYRRWGEGGYGVILTGNVMIEYDQLEAAGNAIVPATPLSGSVSTPSRTWRRLPRSTAVSWWPKSAILDAK